MIKKYLRIILPMLLMLGSSIAGNAQTYCVTSPSIGGTGDIVTKVDVSNGIVSYSNSSTYSTTAPAYFTSYPNTPINLAIGISNSVSITFGADGAQYSAIWIDYNQDGVFQASENVALATTSVGANGVKTYTFTIPPGTPLGTTKMRIRGGSDDAYTASGACAVTVYGETEDYNINITQQPTCVPPTAISVSNIAASSAQVSFTASSSAPAGGYDYFYTSTNTPPAANATPDGNTSGSPFTVTGNFTDNPKYIWIRSKCSDTDKSVLSVTSAYIDAYCKITNSNTGASYFNSFITTGGITNISNPGSGFSPGGYQNATGKFATQVNGSSVSFTTSLVGTTVGVAIWIDWNDNGVFDTNERVYSSGSSYVSTANGSFTVPGSAAPGKHRMRVMMDYNATSPTPCTFAFGRGEVEDYTFVVKPRPPTIAGDSIVCPGATTTLTASGCTTGTVTWSNGAVGTSIVVPAGSYTATCTVDSSTSVASIVKVVTETQVNTPVISGDTMVCPGALSTLTASNCNGTITWSNGDTTSSITAPAGTYTATCTVNGCVSPASNTITVGETNVTIPVLSGGGSVCPGGTYYITASNCSGTITWSNGSTATGIEAPAGAYTATCTVNGCVSPSSDTAVIEEVVPTTPVISGDTAVCPGATTTLTANNCNGTITWSNGETGSTITAPAGTYAATCVIRLGPGRFAPVCTSSASNEIVVNEIPVTTPVVSSGGSVCPGGTYYITASNCNGTITWSNGSTATGIEAPAGAYTATCTVNGCVSPPSDTVVIEEVVPTTPVISGDTAVCPGATTTLTANNCNGTITWSNGETGSTITAPAGTYAATCVIRLGPGRFAPVCTSSASNEIVVDEIPVTTPVVSSGGSVCPGGTYYITASNCNGTITWSNGATATGIEAPAGAYTATCTVNGCVSPPSDTVVIEEVVPTTPVISGDTAVCPGATTTLTANNCNGTITWSNGETGSTITAPAGTYAATCVIRLGPGRFAPVCTSSASNEIVVNEIPVKTPVVSGDTMVCPGALSTLTASSCNGTITWSNGDTTSSISAPAGTYTATCTVSGCVSSASNEIVVTETQVNTPVVSGDTMVCPGALSTLTASNCNGTITWSNGDTTSSIGAPAGTYTATCTVDGCVSPASNTITVGETNVTIPVLSGGGSVCSGGTYYITASNCNGTITWSNGSTATGIEAPAGAYTATCTVNGCVSPPSDTVVIEEVVPTTPVISGDTAVCPGATATLTANNCNNTITWSNGETGSTITAPVGIYAATCVIRLGPGRFAPVCTSSASNEIVVNEIPVKTPVVSGDTMVCPGALSTLTASSCNGTITWSNGDTTSSISAPAGTYTATCTVSGCVSSASNEIVVTETQVNTPVVSGDTMICPGALSTLTANNCNGTITWSNGDTTSSISAPAGTYTATCTVNGCVSPASDTIVVNETQVMAPVITGNLLPCKGSSTTLTANGCDGGIITWSNGTTGNSVSVPAGNYTATCSLNGCTSHESDVAAVLEVEVLPPTISGATSVCPQTTSTLTASNCSGTVTWSTGATGTSIAAFAGSYTATCTINGCTSPASDTFTVIRKRATRPGLSADTIVCTGATATITASNCDGVVTWSNGATGSTLQAPAGTYTATCTIDGCVGVPSFPITITEVTASTPIISGATSVCPQSTSTLTASNCNGTVKWSNGAIGSSIAVPAGSYTATCIVHGCKSPASDTFTVTRKRATRPGLSGDTSICPGATTTLSAANCNGLVTWSNGATGSTLQAPAGTYTATCTIDGCVGVPSFPITVTETVANPPIIGNEGTICPLGKAKLTASGCTGGVITWSTGAHNISINAPQGTYTATCTIDGCISGTSAPMVVKPCKSTPCPANGNLLCNGSFEQPIVTNPKKWETMKIPCWSNFNSVNDSIELQRNLFATATNGSQYAELNNSTPGDIYQDFPVEPGFKLKWSLDHKARENDTNEEITIVISAPDGSNAQTITHTGTVANWQTVADQYQIAGDQTAVRMRIISSPLTTPGRANFIDNVIVNYVGCGKAAKSDDETIIAARTDMPPATLTVHPNPVTANASLILSGFDEGDVGVEITNANGSVTQHMKLNFVPGTKLNVDMSSFRDGLYFIKVQQDGKIATSKVIKQ